MSWVKPKPAATSIIGQKQLPLSQVCAGQLFSINEKSTRFSLVRMGNEEMTVQPVTDGGKLTPPIQLPAPTEDFCVLVYEPAEPEPVLARDFDTYDRVKLCTLGTQGTVIDVNKSKFPDVDLSILWDGIIYGNRITEVHPHEIAPLGIKASGEQYEIAKKAREFLRVMQDNHQIEHMEKVKKEIAQSLSTQQARRAQIIKEQEEQEVQQVKGVVKDAISTYASDFRTITDAGVIAITAGTSNYEIDELPTIINHYADTIYSKVSQITDSIDLRAAATDSIMKKIASTALDTYFLTRQAYIRRHDGKWGVFTSKGKLIATHKTKKGAVQQLRAIEYNKRHRG